MGDEKSIMILDAGAGWLAVDKPAGLSVHNEPGRDLLSFMTEAMEDDSDLMEETAFDPSFGIHPVHRLDRDTSGVILLSCQKRVFHFFSKQFEARTVEKKYTALVHGELDQADPGVWQEWRHPLAKEAGGRKDPAGRGKKHPAITRYRLMEGRRRYSLVEIQLMTGRKHQIRRHARLDGHPLVGDRRYGSPKALQYLSENHAFHRLALHAYSLSIALPDMSGKLSIKTDPVPKEVWGLMKEEL